MITMTDTIYQLTVPTPFAVGDVHTYLLQGERLSLIDAGVKTEEALEAMTTQLKEIGYEPEDIEQIILTHHHPDHIGLVGYFPNATVYGHQDNRPWLEQPPAFFEQYEAFFIQLYAETGVPEEFKKYLKFLRDPLKYLTKGTLHGELQQGDLLPGHPDWVVIETPGHAQSHLSFYREQDGSLLAGDHILPHISSNPLIEPPRYEGGERPKPLLQYRNAMLACVDLGVKRVYPGHGKIFSGIEELVTERIHKQEQRAEKVRLLLTTPKTPFEICTALFPKQFKKELGLAMSETLGQLDYLESIGAVAVQWHDGVSYYVSR
ncbi:beta-lactamase [Pontibacillus halophilus JSM 076056 = DSM 19796]|uniref:Beta-lactamase n=1 Tax=Pontibacillus halophilus JSM 076056 = DSM 19796 TaxID=1385510 RepID=A0A0A5GJN2_9BACI|nr:MBL fold metallo-hydrolase [Pontibacillus halophilus]KGX91365.1 beta-lactamase [Pontibacillus halophilus JSM 076056 = DSM 19796]